MGRRGSLRLQKLPNDLHEGRPLLQERRVGGVLELAVLNLWNAVEEGLNDPVLRNVVRTSIDH